MRTVILLLAAFLASDLRAEPAADAGEGDKKKAEDNSVFQTEGLQTAGFSPNAVESPEHRERRQEELSEGGAVPPAPPWQFDPKNEPVAGGQEPLMLNGDGLRPAVIIREDVCTNDGCNI